MKKALVFDPYLDTLGGGERYTLSFANTLDNLGYSVDLAWPDFTILKEAKARFGLDFNKLKINPTAFKQFTHKTNLVRKLLFQRHYDIVFFLSDGSLPFLFGKRNFVHFQTPFVGRKLSFIDRMKIFLINKFIYNSKFTQKVNEKFLPSSKSVVLYPPVDTDSLKNTTPKENIILSVGRFDSPSHAKRQDILIEAYKKLSPLIRDKYTLILAGALVTDQSYLDPYKKSAKDFNIKFVINPEFTKLKDLYCRAKIFWHASGYEIDEETYPDRVEHFGIVTVEAMASGCIPVVINKGGQREIISSKSGFLCEDLNELVEKTSLLINSKSPAVFRQNAINRSNTFSTGNFITRLKEIL